MFPLSPTLHTGRSPLSKIGQLPLFDPRYHGVETTPAALRTMVQDQWKSRSRPIYTREQIDAMLGK